MESKEKMTRIVNIVSDIVISVFLILSGVLFAVSCYSIYSSAEKQMFTYKSIGAAFEKIQIIVYITLVFVFVGAILTVMFPRPKGRLRSPKRNKSNCLSLAVRVDISKLSDADRNRIEKVRGVRRIMNTALAVIAAVNITLPLVYLLNPATFPAEAGNYNEEVLRGFLVYICMLSPIIAFGIVYAIFKDASYRTEAELLKDALKSGARADSNSKDDIGIFGIKAFLTENKKPITLGLRIAFIGCAVIFIAMGIANGGMTDVLIKAVNICAECIGLG